MLTSFTIQGDAWTWWQGAVGHYQRGIRPVTGSVLVFRRTNRLQYGHVAVVSRVINSRTILVDHSWLEGDVLHRGMKVVDTSPGNNWSSVRVWYEPADNLGLESYPTFGFVYPHGAGQPGDRMGQPLTVAARDADEDADDRTVTQQPRMRTALHRVETDHLVVAMHPLHKPMLMLAAVHVVAPAPTAAPKGSEAPKGTEAAAGDGVVLAYAPRRKPETGVGSHPHAVEFTQVPQVGMPRHKPAVHGGTQVAEANNGRAHDREANAEIGD